MSCRSYTFHTNRLVFREICEEDVYQIVKWRSDRSIYKFFKKPHVLTEEEHRKWYREQYLANPLRISWIAEKNNIEVGIFSVELIKKHIVEISYLLDERCRHNGYGTEALIGIEGYIRTIWDVCFLYAEIHKENIDSQIFIRSLGFHLEKINGNFFIFIKNICMGD